jgi:hypothetical protein
VHYVSVSGLAEIYGGSHLYPQNSADFFTMEKSLESCTRRSCHNELFFVGFMRGLKNQGNVLVNASFENANDDAVVAFVIAYILWCVKGITINKL